MGSIESAALQSVPVEAEAEREELRELSLDDALALAVKLHRAGHVEQAESVYRRILDVEPDNAGALHFLGVLLHQCGDSESGIELIERSIAIDPAEPNRYNNLGNVLVETGKLAEAAEAYQKAIALEPAHAGAYGNLGAVRRTQQRYDDSYAAYQKAIELDPSHADAYNNLGNLFSCQRRVKEAVACYCKAITLIPNHPEARKLLGIAYYTLGEIDKAKDVYREWLQQEPDNPIARHLFAACSGENVPDRASDAYVESSFDNFAQSFDAKLERLGYRAPQLIADALARSLPTPEARLVVLDAGCGTGLCGPLIAAHVSRLIGVDLSAGMLAEAQKRGVYDELHKAELTAFLDAHHESYDVIVSADTLVYFGQLDTVLAAAFGALRPGGLLLFTVEEAAGETADKGYRINPHGRYSHTGRYVDDALTGAGFAIRTMDPSTLRSEGGIAVAGLVVTGCRPI